MESGPLPWWKKHSLNIVLGAIGIAGVYGLIYVDLVFRAKETFQRGERYMSWQANPALKKIYFDAEYEKEKSLLDKKLAKKKIAETEYEEKVAALSFDRDFRMQESSLKYAYHWYKDTYELFSPPESRWVREARLKAVEALRLWKAELTAKNISFEDYMFE